MGFADGGRKAFLRSAILRSVAPDGSFRITGLQPSKVMIFLANYPPLKGFTDWRALSARVCLYGGLKSRAGPTLQECASWSSTVRGACAE